MVQELEGSPKVPAAVVVVAGEQDLSGKAEADGQQTGLGAGCIVDVVIDSSGVVVEANLGHMDAEEVLQQSEMVTEALESTMEMAEMVENISKS